MIAGPEPVWIQAGSRPCIFPAPVANRAEALAIPAAVALSGRTPAGRWVSLAALAATLVALGALRLRGRLPAGRTDAGPRIPSGP